MAILDKQQEEALEACKALENASSVTIKIKGGQNFYVLGDYGEVNETFLITSCKTKPYK
jgi:hypothetical protein